MANNQATAPGTPGASINWASYTAPTTINVFFAGGGVAVSDGSSFTTSTWDAAERAAAKLAFANFAAVANLQFNYVSSIGQADFAMFENPNQGQVQGNFGYWGVGGGTVTYGGQNYALDGYGVFNSDDDASGTQADFGDSWTHDNLQVGGYGYITLIHEIGHGIGLAHPHDNGGGSEIMAGVSSAFGSYGNFDLNQGVYTTMSYNDGWHTAPHVDELNPSVDTYGFGWQGTLMALDIAVLQAKYGANMSYHTGNDVYVMPKSNGPGTYYAAIWDAGGNDTLRYDGSASAVIDLTAATLDYSATGGGVVSYAAGIYGGFTIANGVVIENATGGTGADTITGNAAANKLNGRGGADTMVGLGGNDVYYVDNVGDKVDERGGNAADIDTVSSSINFSLAGAAVSGAVERLILTGTAISAAGNALANILTGNALNNVLNGGGGTDRMIGMAGNDAYNVDSITDVIDERLGSGLDTVRSTVSFSLANTKTVLGAVENLTLLGTAATATGNDLANKLIGNSSANTLFGGLQADTLTGGAGSDLFDFNDIRESTVGAGRDIITDFNHAQKDKIDLSGIDAIAGTTANDKFTFLATEGAAFTKKAGQLHYDQTMLGSAKITIVEGDVTGDGKADFQIQLNGWHNLIGFGVQSDFVL